MDGLEKLALGSRKSRKLFVPGAEVGPTVRAFFGLGSERERKKKEG